MKWLYYVSILHMGADMGSLASDLEAQARARLGKEDTASFWDSIAGFFDALGVRGFKVYQEGQVADGEVGIKIVKEAITQGSKNYQIIEKLLERGAVLVKTEDAALVKQEYAYIAKMAAAKSLRETLRYKLAQGKLLQQRDDFIAKRIRNTLSEGETGILFIGANHDVLSRLPIVVLTIIIGAMTMTLSSCVLENSPRTTLEPEPAS